MACPYIPIMGTEAVCKIAVPVWPEERSDDVLPHPAIMPRRPVRSIFVVGRQIGKIWFLCKKRATQIIEAIERTVHGKYSH